MGGAELVELLALLFHQQCDFHHGHMLFPLDSLMHTREWKRHTVVVVAAVVVAAHSFAILDHTAVVRSFGTFDRTEVAVVACSFGIFLILA